jgi:hypothetical protein
MPTSTSDFGQEMLKAHRTLSIFANRRLFALGDEANGYPIARVYE